MRKILVMLFVTLSFCGCEEEEIIEKPFIDNNLCQIEYIENYENIPNQGNLFSWDSISYMVYHWDKSRYELRAPLSETDNLLHIIEAYSFEGDSAYKKLVISIPDDDFKLGSVQLGNLTFEEPTFEYTRFIELERGSNGYGGITFTNYKRVKEDREMFGTIDITHISESVSQIQFYNLEIYSSGFDIINYPHTKLEINSNLLIRKE
ncbi:hypothetical protein WJR50_33800 [Catalinimonas sp. 4WD22]|uniref:hypothetical protein n=1 Tax=Catalinimonas locisalis TaxID=3133978 RepID=UPI0031014875